MSRGAGTGSRRRVAVPAERSVSSLTLLTLALPLLTVGALALVRPQEAQDTEHPPREAALTRAAVVCPGGQDDGDAFFAVPEAGASGELTLRRPRRTVALSDGRTVRLAGPGALVVQGADALAPGLSGVRAGDGTAVACRGPQSETWFTAVGAGAEHRSVLHLVNPDGGPAVADVTVWGEDGELRVDELRGVLVRGQQTAELDLAALVPRREDLTLRVQVPRGRLSAFLRHRYDELGGAGAGRTWVEGQARPVTTAYLPGAVAGGGRRELVVGNPGTEQTNVSLRLVTARAEFVPRRAPEIVVAPGSTVTVPLGELLGSAGAEGTTTIRLDSDQPVTATLRSVGAGAVSGVPAAMPISAESGLVVPAGAATLVLAGAAQDTEVEVRARDADGEPLDPWRGDLPAGTSRSIPLPAGARWLSVDPGGTELRAAVRLGAGAAAPVLAVPPLTVSRWEPDVRPALY